MKLSLSIVLIISSCVCVIHGLGSSNGEGNDYTWGAKVTGDTLIAREVVTRRKGLLQSVSKTYTLTQAGTAKTISYIRITDLKVMRGASAEITDGGVGGTTLSVRFTSERGAGIKSEIEIWGQ